MKKQSLPPSLSRVRGKSDSEMEDARIIGQLCRAIEKLPASSNMEPSVTEQAARYLYDGVLVARGETRRKKKQGTSTQTSVAKQLRQIGAGSERLAKRLKAADRNVFEALMDAAEAPDTAKEQWHRLNWLLAEMHDLAIRAADDAERALKLYPIKGKSGRPVDRVADLVTIEAAVVYERWTGQLFGRVVNRDSGQPEGESYDFLTSVFQAFSIKANADASIQRFLAELQKAAS